jgi:hypothetical protein
MAAIAGIEGLCEGGSHHAPMTFSSRTTGLEPWMVANTLSSLWREGRIEGVLVSAGGVKPYLRGIRRVFPGHQRVWVRTATTNLSHKNLHDAEREGRSPPVCPSRDSPARELLDMLPLVVPESSTQPQPAPSCSCRPPHTRPHAGEECPRSLWTSCRSLRRFARATRRTSAATGGTSLRYRGL